MKRILPNRPESKRPAYLDHLSKDKRLAEVLKEHTPMSLSRGDNVWLSLIGSIISQQLSVRVASVIRQRFLDIYPGEPSPANVLETKLLVLRSVGLSNAKAQYIHNIAQFVLEEGMSSALLEGMTNDEVIVYLTRIKGVGKWTVEMLLMFTLGREDVFPLDDLGIQHAMVRIYKLKKEDKKAFREKMIKISAKWSPYRTYASLHLWRHKDKK